MNEDEKLKYEIECFNSAIAPFGYADVKEAVRTAIEGGHNGDWVAEQIEEYMDSCGITKLTEIDPNYIAYDSLLQEARNDITELTDKDILNDTSHQVEVYGNFMCTSLDYTEEAKEELLEILKEISVDDETDAVKWLINEMDFLDELNEKRKEYDEENEDDADE